MAEKLTIGFVSPGPARWPHYDSFLKLVPVEIEFDFAGLDLYGQSLYEITGKKAEVVERVAAMAKEKAWQGVIVIGAPTEVMNPGLFEDLKSVLAVPVATALSASIAALRSYNATKLLLLTPFESRLNGMITDHLSRAGFDVVAPHAFEQLSQAASMTPEKIFALTTTALNEVGTVDAIYFQGAVLDPLAILERIESELAVTAIASNPAMLWDIASQLGRKFRIAGYGKLLAQWPKRRR